MSVHRGSFLDRQNVWVVSLWTVIAAFGTYFCMHGFRKPYSAATFDGLHWLGMEFKTLLVVAQVLGYMLSKFVGIKIVSEMQPHRRAGLILLLLIVAELALVMFAVTPYPYNFIWLFVNGLPLGMIFGLVLGFLEGRIQTEALAAGLCTSFIIASGVVKTVGTRFLNTGVSQFWMPSVTGLVFVPLTLLFIWMLTLIPPPSLNDEAARSKREPMSAAQRWAFFQRYRVGLISIIAMFVFITIARTARDDFAPEIWTGLGLETIPSEIYAESETIVALSVSLICGSVIVIRRNRTAFFAALAIALLGAGLIILSLMANANDAISPFAFMVMIGLGLYLPYIVVHTTLFERLIAMTRDKGNIGYLLYLADSFAYLGYVMVLLGKDFLPKIDNFLTFFVPLCWSIAGLCVVCLIVSWVYFQLRSHTSD